MPGLDKSVLDTIDFNLAVDRIKTDIKSDFIIAPHYNAIFINSRDELTTRTYENLNNGNYEVSLPITMSVPKKGGFARPGNILHPTDRLVYQILADSFAKTVEEQIDRERNFSNVFLEDDPNNYMFEQSHDSWDKYKTRIAQLCSNGGYFVKADIANYFERIPQHHLINLLHASGCKTEIVNLLEKVMSSFREKNSFGIVQGLFPSDLLGNFYLSDIDSFCEIHEMPSARYVDDFFIKFNTKSDASRGLLKLIERLRKNGLNINESKSGIFSAEEIQEEENELDNIFDEAKNEIKEEMLSEAADEYYQGLMYIGYGFSIDWEINESEIEIDESEVEFAAVERLYESIDDFSKSADKIEKFCLPLLSYASSDIAIDRSLKSIIEKPYMAKIYNSYLLTFAKKDPVISKKLEKLLIDENLVSDYQYMYIIAALMKCPTITRETINLTLRLLSARQISDETRAIAAIFSAKYGNPQQKNSVKISYDGEHSEFVRSAILYSAKHFTPVEKKTCRKAWGSHSFINSLISTAIKSE